MSSPRSAAWLLALSCSLAPDLGAQAPAPAFDPFPYACCDARDGGIVALGAVLGTQVWAMSRLADVAEPADYFATGRPPGFDRWATHRNSSAWRDASDWALRASAGGAVAAALLAPLAARSDGPYLAHAVTTAAMGAEVAGLTWVTTTLVKDLVGRRRPYAYNESLDAEERVALAGGDPRHVVRSFPSGHASMSFAAAVFAATVVSDTAPGNRALGTTVWTVSLGLAGLAGWSRVQGGVHFPSDVVAGALLGGAIGYAVPRAHRRAATGGPAGGLTLGVAPTPGGGIGVAARIALR